MNQPPTGKRKSTSAWFAVCGLAVILFLIFRPTEPTYNGKTLSEYLIAKDISQHGHTKEGDKEADTAITQMGTKAVPHLVKMLRAQDSIWKQWRIYLSWKLDWLHLTAPPDAAQIRRRGLVGVSILGPLAKAALPDMLLLLSHPDHEVRQETMMALMSLHIQDQEKQKELLKKQFNDTHATVRGNAVMEFVKREIDAEMQRRELTRFLSDLDPSLRFKATNLLHRPAFDTTLIDPVWPQSFVLNDISAADLFEVIQRHFGLRVQLASGLNTNIPININTYGFLPKAESIELLKLVLKEQAGYELQILSNGVMSVTQSPAPVKPAP